MAGSINSFPIVAAPLFILMGNILGAAKITDRIVVFASAVIGWVRGGYAHAQRWERGAVLGINCKDGTQLQVRLPKKA